MKSVIAVAIAIGVGWVVGSVAFAARPKGNIPRSRLADTTYTSPDEGFELTLPPLIMPGARADERQISQAEMGFTTIVKNLLARGADPNVAPTDEQGWTALMVAARTGQVETVQALLSGGADETLKDKSGNTALALADAQGHAEVARILKEQDPGPGSPQ